MSNRSFAKALASVSYDNTLEKFPLGSFNLVFLFFYAVVQESTVVKYLLYSISTLTQGEIYTIISNPCLYIIHITAVTQ